VLILVSHPGIGSGIETLLRLERRYEIRRQRAVDPSHEHDWRPDIVIGETPMVASFPQTPRIILVGEVRPERRSPDGGRTRWLRKDASSAELVAAIDELLGRPGDPTIGRFVLAAFSAAAFLALLALLARALLR